MTSFYPNAFDTDENLHMVQDSLQANLAKDYQPGDQIVYTEGDISRFPPSGIITLIDQCSEPKDRSVSLYYQTKTDAGFIGCKPTDDTITSFKPRRLTTVTMQLRAEHHNSIVDAILAIQGFLGKQKASDTESSILGRVNFLQKLVFSPKAWFEVDKTIGLVPFTVNFTSSSTGTKGPIGEINFEWNFGDGNTTITQQETIEYTYNNPGIFDVSLKVTNSYGEDAITLHNIISARIEAPEAAKITFDPQPGQILTPGFPPILRTPVNQLVIIGISEEKEESVSNAGELLDKVSKKPIDPITNYTWNLGDDLPHSNSNKVKAAYGIGGLHDLALRTDTECGAYRITTYENCIDVVEISNMWLWTSQNKTMQAHEFGFNCETFKKRATMPLTVNRNESFLENNQQKKEFRRNCGFAPKNRLPSGVQGNALLFWASGRNASMSRATEQINFIEYNAFTDVYTEVNEHIKRPWNWVSLVSPDNIYFILGLPIRTPPGMSPTNQTMTTVDLGSMTITDTSVGGYNYVNGAQEVEHNPTYFNNDGIMVNGGFSVYRTVWRGQVGYILRNDNVGEQYSLKNFYKTDGTIGTPFINLVKLTDVPGGGRSEGQLSNLSSGVYLFNNSGIALCYKDLTNTWETTSNGNPGLFKGLQDNKIVGFANEANTLLVTSDGDRKAFLSFDYSPNAFVKFNEADLTFSALGIRPKGEQWMVGVY